MVKIPCPGVGPCQVYDLDLSCCLSPSGALPDPCILDGTPVPLEIIDSAKLAASQLLWALTGRQFGCCTVTIRPCRSCPEEACCPEGGFASYGFPWYPVHQSDGTWTNISCPCPGGQCSCVDLCEINLPYPVCSVDEVRIDGFIIDPTTYRVDNFLKLVRLDTSPGASGASGCWPTCNDLTKEDTEIGTWSITLTYGRPVPELVKRAAAVFACELIKNCMGQPCALPQRVSSVTRQGISVSFLDPMEFLDKGKTGVYLVDLAIKTYNPAGIARRPVVWSPDTGNKWRVETWRPGDPIGPGCT